MNELTGRTLDRAIAVALGYTVTGSDNEGYDLFDPQGVQIYPDGGKLFVYGTPETAWKRTGSWSADANATLAVCAERGWELRFEFDDSEEEITYVAWIAGDVMRPIGSGYMTNEYDGRSTASCQEAAARALLTALAATEG